MKHTFHKAIIAALLASVSLTSVNADARTVRRDIFGKQKDGYLEAPYERREELMRQQNAQMGTLVTQQAGIADNLQQMNAKLVEQQNQTNQILDRMVKLEEERAANLAAQKKLEDEAQKMRDEREAFSFNSLNSSAGVKRGRIVEQNQDGSMTFRVRD